MSGQVSLANDALTLLGKRRITSLDDEAEEARVMTQIMTPAIDFVLEQYPWRCAMYLASLSQLASAPAFGFAYAYQLPTNPFCLRVWQVNGQSDESTWQRYGRTLHWNEATCAIEYVGRTEVEDLDQSIRTAIADYLAYRAAYALTKSASVRSDVYKLYQADLNEARISSALQGSSRQLRMSRLQRVRGEQVPGDGG